MVDLSGSPDLSKIAEAYNIPFVRLANNTGMDDKIKKFLVQKGAGLMECMIDPMDVVK